MGASGLNAVQMTLVIAGIVALLIAGTAIRIGWFGRRKGESVHCRKCNYNLQGLASDRCPECGLTLAAGNKVKGQRTRRPRLVAVAVVLMLVGIGLVVVGVNERVRRVDWYAYKPTAWVISDLKSSDLALYDRAWKEIEGRLKDKKLSAEQTAKLYATAVESLSAAKPGGKDELMHLLVAHFSELSQSQSDFVFERILSEGQLKDYASMSIYALVLADLAKNHLLSASQDSRLIEFALKMQAGPTGYFNSNWFLSLLGDRAAAGKLSPAQRERFFNQAMTVSLTVRPDMIAGESLPYQVSVSGYGPDEGWTSSERFVSLSIDGVVSKENGGTGMGRGFISGTMGSWIPVEQPGTHRLEIVYEVAAFHGEKDDSPEGKPLWSRTYKLSAPFEALPADSKNYVQLQNDPSSAEALRKSIGFSTVHRSREQATVTVKIKNPPVNIAFEVFAHLDGKEYSFGTIASNAGETHNIGLDGPANFPTREPSKKVDLILRSSTAAARRTIDLYEIWNGELVFPDVTLAYPADINKR